MSNQQHAVPVVKDVFPVAAIPGGEFRVRGEHLANGSRPEVLLGDVATHLVVSSESLLVVKVPDGATVGELTVRVGEQLSNAIDCEVGILVAEGLHPVASPVVDAQGNIFATLSGPRGQKTPVSVFKIDTNYDAAPFASDIMNASGLAIDRDQQVYVSSRYDGIIYQVSPHGEMSTYVEGMGVATGLTFDGDENLYVGDRSGTIFKISRDRQIYVYATLEPSIAAYHLAFGADGYLYVTGPTTSSFDSVHRVAPNGDVSTFFRGLGRPQGLAFDNQGQLYVSASYQGRRGIVRIAPDGQTGETFLSGSGIVGLAFAPSGAMIVTTTSSVYRVDVSVRALQLPPTV